MKTNASTATNKISHVDFSKQFEMYEKKIKTKMFTTKVSPLPTANDTQTQFVII